jgi:hypothetical protein
MAESREELCLKLARLWRSALWLWARADLVHIPKFRNGTGKILANASTPDFSGASDIILGYALCLQPFLL